VSAIAQSREEKGDCWIYLCRDLPQARNRHGGLHWVWSAEVTLGEGREAQNTKWMGVTYLK
jgi:hypothetical protein